MTVLSHIITKGWKVSGQLSKHTQYVFSVSHSLPHCFLVYVYICMCMCVWVHTCTGVHTCVYTWLDILRCCYSGATPLTLFWDTLSPWPGTHQVVWDSSPVSPLGIHLTLVPQCWDYTINVCLCSVGWIKVLPVPHCPSHCSIPPHAS